MVGTRAAVLAATIVGAVALAPAALALDANETVLLSRPSGLAALPGLANHSSVAPEAVSSDGTAVAFISAADGLVDGENEAQDQCFVRTSSTNSTVLVSRATGAAGTSATSCAAVVLSADGTKAAFTATGDIGFGAGTHVYVRNLAAATTVLVDRATGATGTIGGGSASPSISADGNRVAFTTPIALDAADTLPGADVYVRDVGASQTFYVSRANGAAGSAANSTSSSPSIDADGTTVAFVSDATNLGTTDTNGVADIYVRDLVAGTTEHASRATTAGGALANAASSRPSINGDGTRVAFLTSASNLGAVNAGHIEAYVRDLAADTTAIVTVANSGGAVANGSTFGVAIDSVGTKIAFTSSASNLNADDTDTTLAAFVRDTVAATTQVASRSPAGAAGPAATAVAIAAGGTLIAFASQADAFSPDDNDNFTNAFVRNTTASTTTWVSRPDGTATGPPGFPPAFGGGPRAVSADGRFVVFSASVAGLDAQAAQDVSNLWRRDLLTNTTTLVSRATGGSGANAASSEASISADGTRVAFTTTATNLDPLAVSSVQRVYVRNLTANTTVLASQAGGTAGGGDQPAISADGTRVAFRSTSALAGDDTNGTFDVYVRDLAAATTVLASRDDDGLAVAGASHEPSLDADGSRVAFRSAARLTTADQTLSADDVFVHDLSSGLNTVASIGTVGQVVGGTPALDGAGTKVAFAVASTGDIFRRDLSAGTSVLINSASGSGFGMSPSISADGSRVAWFDTSQLDGRGAPGAYVRDVTAATTTRISVGTGTPGALPNGTLSGSTFAPSISGNGQCAAFTIPADNLVPDAVDGFDHSRAYLRAIGPGCVPGAPQTSISAPFTTATNDTTPTFTLTSTAAGSTFECALDAAALASCPSSFTTGVLADGTYTLRARATDPGGIVDPTPATKTFTIDTVAPDTTVSGVSEGAFTQPAPPLTLGATEAGATFECRADPPSSFAACTSPYHPPQTSDGPQSVEVRAIDPAGNVDPSADTLSFVVDGTPVDLQFTSAPAITNDSTPTFTFTFDDHNGSGANEFETQCAFDDPAFQSGVVQFCGNGSATGFDHETFGPMSDGDHELTILAKDLVGNISVFGHLFRVDTVVPETLLTSGPANGATVGTATPAFGFASSEPAGATFECRVLDDPFAACTSPFAPTLADGQHTIEIRTTDPAGNVDATPLSRVVVVETTAPDTTITAGPAEGALLATGSPSFSFEATKSNSTFACRVSPEPFAPCTSPFVPALADGQHTFEVRATDSLGHEDSSPATRTFTVDTTPPDTVIGDGPAQDAVVTGDVSFSFSASEPSATFACRLDGPFAACISPFAARGLAPGGHLFAVRATDPAGNADSSPAQRTFTVAAAPVPTPTPTATPTPAPGSESDAQPRSRITPLKRVLRRVGLRRFGGTARDDQAVARVEIALVRTVGRRACAGLAASGALRRQPPKNGRCAARTWLKASGTTKWTFRLKRRLPRGAYQLFSRAIDDAGQVESTSSKAAGNLIAFTLR